MEVVNFSDNGYLLADNQADLTLKQKLFLMEAIPLVRKKQEKESKNNSSSDNTSLKDKIRMKRRNKM
ncbi:MAG: hypothetical protein KO202_05740 [Methanobacteriaceae archaeon]|nr:hypothetical protein [Methanobacteriaceae archaeon]